MHPLSRLLIACLLAGLSAAAAATGGTPVRIAWGAHNAPPYALSEHGRLTGGLIHQLGGRLAAELGSRPEFVNVPRSRYEAQLRDGAIDLVCIVNPDWLAQPHAFTWSQPLFEEDDILVQRRADAPWRAAGDLAGKRLGTILGYRYPTLEPMLGDGVVHRDDAANLDSNLRRLVLGRIDGVVDAAIPARYWLLRHDPAQRLQIAPLRVSSHPVSCAISTRAEAGAARIKDVLDGMVRRGEVRRLVAGWVGAD